MTDTANVRIKLIPGGDKPRPATTKVFLPFDRAKKHLYRPLEPFEIVALPAEDAKALLEKLPYELELTLEPANRPLYFNDQDEAIMTSQNFKAQTYGRSEDAKQRQEEMRARVAADEAARASEPAPAPEQETDIEEPSDEEVDEEYGEASNNAVSPAELKKIREGGDATEERKPRRRRRKS